MMMLAVSETGTSLSSPWVHPGTAAPSHTPGAGLPEASRSSTAHTSGPSCGTPTSGTASSTSLTARAAVAVSRLTTLTYLGSLLGPAVIGAAAQAAGLRATLAALVPLLAVTVAMARLTAGRDRRGAAVTVAMARLTARA